MLIKLINEFDAPISEFREDTVSMAYVAINNYKMRAADLKLDEYLRTNVKFGLKDCCKKIILNLQFLNGREPHEVLVILPNQNLDKLASIIRFGNTEIGGSNILKFAFKQATFTDWRI